MIIVHHRKNHNLRRRIVFIQTDHIEHTPTLRRKTNAPHPYSAMQAITVGHNINTEMLKFKSRELKGKTVNA